MNSGSDTDLVVRHEIDHALRNWLRGNGQILHVEGAPGSGKTSWMELLAASGAVRENSGQILARVAAHHFCRRDNARSASAVYFLESVATQLARAEPRFAQAIAERSGRNRGIEIQVTIDLRGTTGASAVGIAAGELIIQAASPADLLHEIVAPLQTLLADAAVDWLIVVDAPDEPSERALADLLLSLGDMPRRLKFIITSRSGTWFARAMARAHVDRLDLAVVCERSASLDGFLLERVTASGLLARLAPGQEAAQFLDALRERIQDNFLVATCAVLALAADSGALGVASVAKLPASLPGFFHRFLERLPGQMVDSWSSESGPIIGSLAVAMAPLSEADLVQITSLPPSIVRDRLTRLRPYLRGNEGGWRLFHATFAEFLLDSAQAHELWCPGPEQHERFVAWMSRTSLAQASAYALAHFVSHVTGAGTDLMLERLDRALEPAVIAARLTQGSSLYAVAEDFQRMLLATSARSDVARTLFLVLLMVLWQRKVLEGAASASTTLLAAMGNVRAASDLALRQESTAASGHEVISQRTRYAVSLVAMGEVDEALRFAAQADAAGATQAVRDAALDALAMRLPSRAAPILGDIPLAQRPKLSAEACRALASRPECVQISLSLATIPEARLAVAEACARHDIGQALMIVADIDFRFFYIKLGGDKLLFDSPDAVIKVLIAFLDAHPEQADLAWDLAQAHLGSKWREPFGFLLAGAFAAIDANRGMKAFAMLSLLRYGVHRAIAVAWIGARGGDALLAKLLAQPDTFIPWDAIEPDRNFQRQLAGVGLRSALSMLELVVPEHIPRHSDAFRMMARLGDTVLDLLEQDPEIPEFQEQASYALGRLFAGLDMSLIARLRRLLREQWCRSAYDLGRAVAISLAYQGSAVYLEEKHNRVCPECWDEAALIDAAGVIAKCDPDSVIVLIDHVPERFSSARAELAGIAAVALRQAGMEIPSRLQSKLTPFTRSAGFLGVAECLVRACDSGSGDSDMPDAVRLNQEVLAAVASGDSSRLLALVPGVEALSMGSAQIYRGDTIWAKEVRRNLAEKLENIDPVQALRVLLPAAQPGEITRLARTIVARNSTDKLSVVLAAYDEVAQADSGGTYAMWRHDVFLAFALALPADLQASFVDTVPDEDARLMIEALEGIDEPIAGMRLIAGRSEFYDLWLSLKFTAALCQKDSSAVFGELDKLFASESIEVKILCACVGEHWPLAQWRQGIQGFLHWAESRRLISDGTYYFAKEFLDSLLSRVVRVEPRAAFDALHALPEETSRYLDISSLERNLVTAALAFKPIDENHFPVLVEAALAIGDASPRRSAVITLLDALRHIRDEAQAHCCCLALKAVGCGYGRLDSFWEVDRCLYAALRAAPDLINQGQAIVTHLDALLRIDLPVA